MNRTWRNWVPAVAVTAVVGAGALVVPLTANAAVDLPDLSAAEVLELAAGHSVDTLSGTVEQTSDLGLPDLSLIGGAGGGGVGAGPAPGGEPDGAASPESAALELLTTPHTARVFLSGPSQARIQVMDQMAERNIILNGGDLWFYDSEDNSVVHATLQDHEAALTDLPDIPTPDQLATLFLEKVDPSTELTVGPDRSVAGRAAYQLIMTPRADETLVGAITIDVDADTGFPLAVSVAATGGSTPAFSAAYTDISFDAPLAETFDFTPPAGATVTETPERAGHSKPDSNSLDEYSQDNAEPTVTGSGWESVVEFPAGAFPTDNPEMTGMLDQLSTPVNGGQLLQTRLVNILLADDGRVLVGSVPADRLQAAADE
ncbi:outer membrane lipoprotein carrier protein LolA [Arthrobacter sp. H20]|uniref:LolA family protein n=1 Tax=Arthrobacter sp. H20 TaxID=1267981 RepID=UPI000479A810|nr:outer membrane lipoprotein carrier protein LolA [Arthrobacter sp. H20]